MPILLAYNLTVRGALSVPERVDLAFDQNQRERDHTFIRSRDNAHGVDPHLPLEGNAYEQLFINIALECLAIVLQDALCGAGLLFIQAVTTLSIEVLHQLNLTSMYLPLDLAWSHIHRDVVVAFRAAGLLT